MHQLLLLRHAKSSWDEAKLPDRDRPLNGRGRRAAAAMRIAMRDLGLVPDLILLSPSRRTQETLAGLEPWDETPLVEPMEVLYLASAGQLLGVLHGIAETVRSVLMIGHNPGLHDLAIDLVGKDAALSNTETANRLIDRFPTGALAEFAVSGQWQRLGTGGGRLLRFITPRDLPQSDT